MREIKFRGKSIDTCTMVFGYYFYDKKTGKHYIIVNLQEGERVNVSPEIRSISFEVIPETVGQFTGRNDKNYIDIYSNDIVLYNGKRWVIIDDYMMNIVPDAHSQIFYDPDKIEIIGNATDNPEYGGYI